MIQQKKGLQTDLGKLKDVILHRHLSFAGRKIIFKGAVEDDGIAWVSLTANLPTGPPQSVHRPVKVLIFC
jgi:hypothetical protein